MDKLNFYQRNLWLYPQLIWGNLLATLDFGPLQTNNFEGMLLMYCLVGCGIFNSWLQNDKYLITKINFLQKMFAFCELTYHWVVLSIYNAGFKDLLLIMIFFAHVKIRSVLFFKFRPNFCRPIRLRDQFLSMTLFAHVKTKCVIFLN